MGYGSVLLGGDEDSLSGFTRALAGAGGGAGAASRAAGRAWPFLVTSNLQSVIRQYLAVIASAAFIHTYLACTALVTLEGSRGSH
jgi:hypothetical protein